MVAPADRWHAWVNRCQQYSLVPVESVADACDLLAWMATSVPPALTPAESDVARRLLTDAWQRVLELTLPGSVAPPSLAPPGVAPAIDEPMTSAHTVPDAPVSGAGTVTRGIAAALVDERVIRALAEIDRRFSDPTLRLHVVARHLAVSPTHLTHLLRLATGHTFGAHLHLRRVSQARVLLTRTGLSVKEVASRVGYASTTQLDRHFKRLVHRLPSEERVRPQIR